MNKKSGGKQAGKRWVHPPSSLTNGHVVYNVKLLGRTEVDQPKGAEVVKEAVRKLKPETQGFHSKLQFAKQLKRAEGEKPQKVELTISSMGVTIQDRQTKIRIETFPLHRISYCADDKQDKRICAFITKQETTNKNMCFVMDSDKCAEEITLTVGQAFDLAYQQFLQTSGKTITTQVQSLQTKVRELETENTKLRMRIVDLEARQGVQPPPYSESNTDGPSSQPPLLKDLIGSQPPPFQASPAGAVPPNMSPLPAALPTMGPQAATPMQPSYEAAATNGVGSPATSDLVQSPGFQRDHPPSVGSRGRPRSSTMPACFASASTIGTSVTSRPRPHGISTPSNQSSILPSLAPPPRTTGRARRGTTPAPAIQDSPGVNNINDPFGQAPFAQQQSAQQQSLGAARSNPFLAMSSGATGSSQDFDFLQYQEIQEGFASGLTLGNNEDLSLDDLDPLKNMSNC